jgi:hypothetical protein
MFPAIPPSLSSARMDFYREKTVQCLILGNFTMCPPYTVEAFLQYFTIEYFRSQDTQYGVWMMVGMIVRVAFRMGYHREPSRFPNISPFKGEMRRRLWAMVVQLDLMSSTQVGLPRMIQPFMHDVREPRNLNDDDLDEDTTELPPSRPDTDPTINLYTVARNRVLHVFARVVDMTNSSTQPAYQDVMELDNALHAVFEKLPESMRAIRFTDFDKVDSNLAMRRLYLGLSFLRAKLMIHRPYLLLARTDKRYEDSRIACLDAALEMLKYQKLLDVKSRPGGWLWSHTWRLWAVSWRLSSLVNHDFLLATTVLALELDNDISSPIVDSGDPMTEQVRSIEIVEALKDAYAIWLEGSEKSREAKRVAAALKVVLGKANDSIDHSQAGTSYAHPHQHDRILG